MVPRSGETRSPGEKGNASSDKKIFVECAALFSVRKFFAVSWGELMHEDLAVKAVQSPKSRMSIPAIFPPPDSRALSPTSLRSISSYLFLRLMARSCVIPTLKRRYQ